MANFKHLRDLYRQPGFVPSHQLRGKFGDPIAVVISLRRCRKKRFAGVAARSVSATTTSDVGLSEIFRAVIGGSTYHSSFDEFFAPGVTA